MKEFHTWLSGQKDIVRECADHSGDMNVVERKLQKLKVHLILHVTEQFEKCCLRVSSNLSDLTEKQNAM